MKDTNDLGNSEFVSSNIFLSSPNGQQRQR